MSWRTVIISSRCKLDLSFNYLVIRGEVTTKIHLTEISTLIIETTAVSITAALLSELMKCKVKVIFCDEKRNPESELIPYYGRYNSSSKLKTQLAWQEKAVGNAWTCIVREKINQQKSMLKLFELDGSDKLESYIKQIEYRDNTNREGHAAKVYFNSLFGKDFTREDENSINASLNYGYGIILSAFNREIVSDGYLTQLGLFHNNVYNYFNLSCDLMEPFRPLIDKVVYENKSLEFGKEMKRLLVGVLNQKVIIGGTEQYVDNAIKIYCKSIFNSIENNDMTRVEFYKT